jgi:hypothetical protein
MKMFPVKPLSLLHAVLLPAMLAMATPVYAQTVEQWQKAAVQKHPALAQAGSPLNQRFLEFVAEKRKSEPAYFTKADWPLRAAEAAASALLAEEMAAGEKAKAEETAKMAELTPEEREWERDKARWVFDRLVFGDSEDAILAKLNHSKMVTARVTPKARVPLSSRFQWVLGESKFYLDFEMKDGLAAITCDCLAERTDALDSLIHDDWSRLRAGAIEQFGPPTKSVEYPEVKKLRRAGWTVTDTWERPGCRVKLGITEEDGKCSASLRISDPARAAE